MQLKLKYASCSLLRRAGGAGSARVVTAKPHPASGSAAVMPTRIAQTEMFPLLTAPDGTRLGHCLALGDALVAHGYRVLWQKTVRQQQQQQQQPQLECPRIVAFMKASSKKL
ncbi:hypothetical protein E2C01_001768 [Portunus trituberculatus]|uniref:Uncharacterized protein n=1 Tax=Portunus trituberculatus TaxID=210409 RepID=A0A5B7CIS7_PORTR|nr:hypothetical protein [Portunus trituberculatus]